MVNDDSALELSPKLPKTPGWEGLSEERKKWLQRENSDVLKIGIVETHAAIASASKLMEIEAGLKSTTMLMKDYLKFNFPRGEATGNRYLKGGRRLKELWGAEMFSTVVRDGSLLRGFLGIGMNELIKVTEEVGSVPHTKEAKQIEGYFEKRIRPALAERRIGRQGGTSKRPKIAEDSAARNIFRSGILYKRQVKGLHTMAEIKAWMQTFIGWWMQDWAIPGTLECKRLPVPDGVYAVVGRPRNKTTKKAGKT